MRQLGSTSNILKSSRRRVIHDHGILHKKEIVKLGAISLEKSLSNEGDQRLVWAFLRSGLDSDWSAILDCDPKVSEKNWIAVLPFVK